MSRLAGCDYDSTGTDCTVSYSESPLVFKCHGERLIGIVAKPVAEQFDIGVLIVVGGPQYRAGSHRQFTLLARDLACNNVASLRFDARGMGDSEGDTRTFDDLDDDIAAAIETFFLQIPMLRSVIIWGLCDAASAALIYAYQDPRVSGLVLLNPWVHTDITAKHARLKYYYIKRFLQPSLWGKLFLGEIRLRASIREFIDSAHVVLSRPKIGSTKAESTMPADSSLSADLAPSSGPEFIARMLRGLQRFRGGILFILSGNDLTAQEFIMLSEQDQDWRKAHKNKNISCCQISHANHTFASNKWRTEVSMLTLNFVRSRGIRV